MDGARPKQASLSTPSRFTECSLCLGKINNPRTLPCIHSFCNDCLLPLVEGNTLKCPLCKETCKLRPGGVAGLPRNPMLVEALERVCDACQERNKETQCQHCGNWECAVCRELCKLQAELKDVIKMWSTKIEEIKKEKNKRICSKDEHLAWLNEKVQKAIETILAVQDKIAQEFETELQKQTIPLDDLVANISDEIKKIEAFITKSDQDREDVTVSSVQQMLDDYRKALTNTKASHPIPPSTAKYDAGMMDEMADIVSQLAVEPTKYRSTNITYEEFASGRKIYDMSSALAVPPLIKTVAVKPTNYKSKNIKYEVFGTKGYGEGQFDHPTCIALSPVTDNIAVLDAGKHRIQIFNSQRKYLRRFGSNGQAPGQFELYLTGGIIVTSQGHIVVADSGNNRLQILTEQGEVIKIVGLKGQGPGQFDFPKGLAVHRGHIYVSDLHNYRIQILNENGVFVREIATSGDTGDWKPHDVAVCANGDIVVVVWRPDAGCKLMIFSRDGDYKTSLCTGTSESVKLKSATGVVLDDQENIIVTDSLSHKVHVVTKKDELIRSFGFRGDKPGQLNSPIGVVCTRNGNIMVADAWNHRIQTLKFQ